MFIKYWSWSLYLYSLATYFFIRRLWYLKGLSTVLTGFVFAAFSKLVSFSYLASFLLKPVSWSWISFRVPWKVGGLERL